MRNRRRRKAAARPLAEPPGPELPPAASGSPPAAGPGTEPPAAESPLAAGIMTGWRVVAAVAGQTTLAAALLYYFGWARTQAVLGYFGINAAVAGLSVNDYILRSLNTAIRFFVILGLLVLILVLGHLLLSAFLAARRRPGPTRAVSLFCAVSGLGLCLAGLLGFYNRVVYSTRYPFVPIMLAVGVTLLGYAFHLYGASPFGIAAHKFSARVQVSAVIMLDIVFVFWTVAVYAGVTGGEAAAQLAANLAGQPSVSVYSEKPLGLNAPAQVTLLPSGSSQYRYRYTGLRLLLYSAGQYFLVPDGWQRGRDPVFLVRESDGLRFEFYAGS